MELKPAKLIRLGKTDAQSAAVVLTRAFQNYPVYKYYYPDDRQRIKANRYLNIVSAYFGIHYGEMYATSQNLEGIAIWIPAAEYNMNFWRLLRSVPLSVLLSPGLSAGLKMRAMGEYVDRIHRRLAPFNHWYLFLLGVDPQYQGNGYASRLLKPMLIRADEEKLPCYLETNDEVDVPIYQHFGFKVVEEETIPKTANKNWAMLRKVGGV